MASAKAPADQVTIVGRIFNSTIGLKFTMAVTGAGLVLFVLQHMTGNLQIFLPLGADGLHPINKYAHFLQSLGGVVWAARLTLLVGIGLHIMAAIKLKRRNDAARPVGYDQRTNIQAKKPSYMMTLSGMTILAFVLYHLAHYTVGVVDTDSFNQYVTVGGVKYHDVHKMVIASFSQPITAGLYIVANVLLGLHLHHAASSMFQTLGLRTSGYASIVDKIGPTVAVVVIAGNVSMPLAVLLGIVR